MSKKSELIILLPLFVFIIVGGIIFYERAKDSPDIDMNPISEEVITSLGDRFIIEYSHGGNESPYHGTTYVRIKDCQTHNTIVSTTFTAKSLEKEKFKPLINTSALRCYYIYGCLIYREENQWDGVSIDNMEKEKLRYIFKMIPHEAKQLAYQALSQEPASVYTAFTDDSPGDSFSIQFSQNPFTGTAVMKIGDITSNKPIISIVADEKHPEIMGQKIPERKDFKLILNKSDVRCYLIYDCLIYGTDKSWAGIYLDSIKQSELYYSPDKMPEEIRKVAEQVLATAEEVMNTELNDQFIVEYSQIPNDWRVYNTTFVKIKDNNTHNTIVSMDFDEKCLEKETFKTLINTASLNCYYIYGCLIYNDKGKWDGIRIDYMQDEKLHYPNKNIPVQIRSLAQQASKVTKEVNKIDTEIGEPFIIEYSKNPLNETARIKITKSNNPIIAMTYSGAYPYGQAEHHDKDDFKLLENTLDLRCYLFNDYLLYRSDQKWEGIPLDYFKHKESYYCPQKIPYEIRILAKQILEQD